VVLPPAPFCFWNGLSSLRLRMIGPYASAGEIHLALMFCVSQFIELLSNCYVR
jgi:hypothetical protein